MDLIIALFLSWRLSTKLMGLGDLERGIKGFYSSTNEEKLLNYKLLFLPRSVWSAVMWPPLINWFVYDLFIPNFSIRDCCYDIKSSLFSRSSFLDLTYPPNRILLGWYWRHASLKAFLTKLIWPLHDKHFSCSSMDLLSCLLWSPYLPSWTYFLLSITTWTKSKFSAAAFTLTGDFYL